MSSTHNVFINVFSINLGCRWVKLLTKPIQVSPHLGTILLSTPLTCSAFPDRKNKGMKKKTPKQHEPQVWQALLSRYCIVKEIKKKQLRFTWNHLWYRHINHRRTGGYVSPIPLGVAVHQRFISGTVTDECRWKPATLL